MNILFKLACAGLILTPSKALAEEVPPIERTVWLIRAKVPQVVADYKTMREYVKWCIYELEQDDPIESPCKIANELKEKIDNEGNLLAIKSSIQVLKNEPQTDMVREHLWVLEDGLHEIKRSIKPIQ